MQWLRLKIILTHNMTQPTHPNSNMTLIGASANIVTATMLDKSGHRMTFMQWLKIGVPTMIVTVAAANLYMLRYAF